MTVLLALPDQLLTSMLRAGLSAYQCDFTIAHDQHTFVDLCRNKKFDFVITSFFAPFLSGKNIAATIKSASHPMRTSIFLVCTFQYEHALVQLSESGIDQYITLPLNIERISRKIHARI